MGNAAQAGVVPETVADIPLQPASQDIWDTKYRLKTKAGQVLDETVDATFQRVARALADIEESAERREEWYEKFIWALRHGAIPAGRIVSNAGAWAHKPATSTINCTVSATIADSMDDILRKVHEAGLTLKAGCVAPGSNVVTERGVVSAERAVRERHARMLCYDRTRRRFEMRRIERHMTTRVPRAENIEIVSNGAALKTSIRHPVLIYREEELRYVRADEVREGDALVHYAFPWTADQASARQAWYAGVRLGAARRVAAHAVPASVLMAGLGLPPARVALTWARFKLRAVCRDVITRVREIKQAFFDRRPRMIVLDTPAGTPPLDSALAAFEVESAVGGGEPTGASAAGPQLPDWIAAQPQKHFLPFLAGLIEAGGSVSGECGRVAVTLSSRALAERLVGLLGLFGVRGVLAPRPRAAEAAGPSPAPDGVLLKIADTAFLARVAAYMAGGGMRGRIVEHCSQAGQHDHYVLPRELGGALQRKAEALNQAERQALGFYHDYHRRAVVSRVWLERWGACFPEFGHLIAFARTLRPVEAIHRALPISETFYDFTVEKHSNYLAGEHGLMVIHNCGIGYEFSTLRPKGAYVSGAGAYTSGPLSFMDIYDKMCFTVSSAGGRRGAQMATFDVGHPDVLDFIRAKREAGRLRQFNLSLLITDEFMDAVESGADWPLAFPLSAQEVEVDGIDLDDPERVIWREWPESGDYVTREDGLVACRIFRRLKAQRIWDMIMAATYDYAEPGFVLIDRVNELNNNWFCEEIRATNPCGEQPLPPFGACLLGSVNLTKFVREPFTERAWFDWEEYRRVVGIFTRMLDNVVEINGLPLPRQREEILRKRRHGMGFLGLGSTLTMLRLRYGAADSLAFTERAAKEMALAGWRSGLELAEEKGPAPIMDEDYTLTEALLAKRPELKKDGYRVGQKVKGRVLWARYSRYMQRIAEADPELVERLAEKGSRFTHHSSIAPTGTISLSLANNASNGIEPSFAHHYFRNVIRAGRKSKEKVDVYSFELLAYRHFVDPQALPSMDAQTHNLPDYFITADDITPQQHVDIQAAAQKWIDSSISKTANVPTDYAYEDFKDIYRYAYQQGLKGCTTFRFNPEAFQGVLVKEQDLANTTYRFRLEDGRVIEAQGGDEIEYDGEIHTAANLYDALKEGYYGKW